VEKIPHPTDQRSFLYRPTFELLAYLGINKTEDLPEFEEFRAKVEESIEQFSNKEEKEDAPTDPDTELSSEQRQEEEEEFLDSSDNEIVEEKNEEPER
jgi:hypothetical protein